MFKEYIRFNIKILGLHIFLCVAMLMGIILTYNIETYAVDMFFVIGQIWAISLIPNVVFLFLRRKEQGNVLGFLGTAAIIPIPHILIAIFMRLFYI